MATPRSSASLNRWKDGAILNPPPCRSGRRRTPGASCSESEAFMARCQAPLLFLVFLGLTSASAFAQEPQATGAPAHVSFVDGSAVLERDGQVDANPTSMPLLAGDRLRTQSGRVEVLFTDGSALHLDANTVLDFQSDEVVRLLDGRIRLAIAGPARDVSYRVDAPAAWVQINDPGEYRIAVLRNADVELAVLRGAAELVNEQGRSFIRAGERTFAREGSSPSPPYVYNSAAWDEFDRWSEARRDRRLSISAQYLPSEVRPYAASFDNYGDWRYEQTYGYVWYPRVYTGWRPYYRGRWASLRPYGWTWIAGDPWGWPTHHYGRWGISAGAWFWIPGRHWGPAWVSWAYAPNYVSWCPLGWNNRAVFSIVNVNIFDGRHYSPWHGWTVIPRRHFHGGHVNVGSFASVHVDQRIRNTFVVRDSAPETRYAVGRSVPIRSAGRYAVPRGSVPGTFAAPSVEGARRAPIHRTASGSERTLSAPSRSSRSVSAAPSQGDPQGSPETARTGARAISRERTGPDQGVSIWRGDAVERRGGESREYRRTPEARRPSGEAAVTAAPDGAVRAVPRVRQPSDVAPIEPRTSSGERTRVREDRAPVYSSPPAASPASRSEEPGVYGSNPGYRRGPEAGENRGRAVPRSDPPPSAPSYRSAPEQRRGPSEPPPSAAAPQERSSGDSGSASRSREHSGGARSSGQAVQRRR
jgi:hypothetical protein